MSEIRLPVETWQQIIRLATLVPGALDTSLHTPLEAEHVQRLPWYWKPSRRDTKVKVAVSTVCKIWREIALQYLFEMLFIDTDRLVRELSKSTLPERFEGPSSPFRHVRRLEVHTTKGRPPEEEYEALKRVLRRCRNLAIYKQYLPQASPLLLTFVLTECGQSLRQLEIFGRSIDPTFPHLLNTKAPLLERLSLPSTAEFEGSFPIDLPKLHTLSLPNTHGTYACVTWNTPSARRIDIHEYSTDELLAILAVVPRHITMLTIESGSAVLQQVLDLFPSLEILHWSARLGRGWRALRGTFPALKEIRLRCLSKNITGVDGDEADEALQVITNREMFPSLAAIHQCEPFNRVVVSGSGWWSGWETWSVRLQALDIQLVEEPGSSLELASSSIWD